MKRGSTPDRLICSICFQSFHPSAVDAQRPSCPHCDSEAIDTEVIPLRRFLGETSLQDLVELERTWSEATGFYESYKQAKLKRIQRVVKLKKQFGDGARASS
jgi:hypothetical protein